MKKLAYLLCGLTFMGIVPFCLAADEKAPAAAAPAAAANTPAPVEQAPPLKTEAETRGYALGMSFGKNLKHSEPNFDMTAVIQGIKDGLSGAKNSYAAGITFGREVASMDMGADTDAMIRGLKDASAGGKTLLSEEEAKTVFKDVQRSMVQKMADKNRREGEDFLAENKKKEGVVTLPSGLEYKVIKEGEGQIPTASDTVSVSYRGTFLDGTEFDGTDRHGGKPQALPVTGVIRGWSEALQKMKVGSKWQLFIPPALAYGERGYPNVIPPESTLIFEMELLGIEPPKAAPPSANEMK